MNKAISNLSELRRAAKKRERAKQSVPAPPSGDDDSPSESAKKRPRLQTSTVSESSSSSKGHKSSAVKEFAKTLSSLQKKIKVEMDEKISKEKGGTSAIDAAVKQVRY